MSALLSRRSAFGAIVAAPTAAAAAVAHAAQPLALTWSDALGHYRQTEAAYDAFLANVCNPAHSELSRRTGPMPPINLRMAANSGRHWTWRYDAARPDDWQTLPLKTMRDAAARHAQQCQDWSAAYNRAAAELGIDAIDRQEDDLCITWIHAEDRLMNTPAPDAAAVLTKLEIIWAEGRERSEENERQVLRDLRLLASLPVNMDAV